MIIAWLLVIRDRLAIISGVSDYLSEYSQTFCLSRQDVLDFCLKRGLVEMARDLHSSKLRAGSFAKEQNLEVAFVPLARRVQHRGRKQRGRKNRYAPCPA
jgi:hypothetical protein